MSRPTISLVSAVIRAPMLRIATPFILGVLFGHGAFVEARTVYAMLAFTTLLLAIVPWKWRYTFRWARAPILALWFFAFGTCWVVVRDPMAHPDHVAVRADNKGAVAMRIATMNGATEKVVRGDAFVIGAEHNGTMQPANGKVMFTLMRSDDIRDPVAGDEVLVRSRIEPIFRIPDPGGFDRRSWAASRGMYYELFAGPNDWKVVGHGWQWTDLFKGARDKVAGWLAESGLPLRERAMVKALVLGMRDELDGDQRGAFVRSGTIHVLAVSGTHVGFIYIMLLFMFRWWGGGRKARLLRGAFILVALWGYAGLTGGCPSVLRATIMFSLFTMAGMVSQRADPLNSLFIAALVLLIWDPHMIIEIGFQLSFLAVLGIILFHQRIERSWVPDNVWVGRIWTLSVLSIAAQLLTTPLTLYYFQAFPIYFLPANIFVVTAAGFAVYGAVALLFLFRLPIVGPAITFLLMCLLMAVGHVTEFFANMPGAYPAIRISIPQVALLYFMVATIAVALQFRSRIAGRSALLCTSCLLLVWMLQARSATQRVAFTIYDDRQAMNGAFTVGRDLIILSEEDPLEEETWMGKKVERHRRSIGAKNVHWTRPEDVQGMTARNDGRTLVGGGYWIANGLIVRFWNGQAAPRRSSNGLRTDVLVIHDVRYVADEDLGALVGGTAEVVLAGELPWKVRRAVRNWCDVHGVVCHDVKEQGAYLKNA